MVLYYFNNWLYFYLGLNKCPTCFLLVVLEGHFSLLSISSSLFQSRHLKDLRCIVFVERVITAIVLQKLLSKLLPKLSGWEAGYIAGNASQLQSQSRRVQNALVDDFRNGTVWFLLSKKFKII